MIYRIYYFKHRLNSALLIRFIARYKNILVPFYYLRCALYDIIEIERQLINEASLLFHDTVLF